MVWSGLTHMSGASAGMSGIARMARVSLDMISPSRRLAWTCLHGELRFPATRERASPSVQVLVKPLLTSHLQMFTGQSKSPDSRGREWKSSKVIL